MQFWPSRVTARCTFSLYDKEMPLKKFRAVTLSSENESPWTSTFARFGSPVEMASVSTQCSVGDCFIVFLRLTFQPPAAGGGIQILDTESRSTAWMMISSTCMPTGWPRSVRRERRRRAGDRAVLMCFPQQTLIRVSRAMTRPTTCNGRCDDSVFRYSRDSRCYCRGRFQRLERNNVTVIDVAAHGRLCIAVSSNRAEPRVNTTIATCQL